MQAIGSDDNEPTNIHQLESYTVRDVFDKLERSGEIPVDHLAALEFKYIDVFDSEDSRIPNLEKQIEKTQNCMCMPSCMHIRETMMVKTLRNYKPLTRSTQKIVQ